MAQPEFSTIEELEAWYTSNIDNPFEGYPGTIEQWNQEVRASYEKGMESLGYEHEPPTAPPPEPPTAPPEVPPLEPPTFDIPAPPTPPTIDVPTPPTPPEMPAPPTIDIPAPPTPPTIEAPPAPTPPVMPEVPTIEAPAPPIPPTMPEAPTIDIPGAPTPPEMPGVPEVPPYERLPGQVALEEDYGEALSEWREAKGYGIPQEVQDQMFQRATDILKARETESIRTMQDNMERRGITNTGFVFANEMTIKAGTTEAIANSITDIQIKSELMRMASFEKAMGASAQFLGYLSEQSQLAYAPQFAQWQAEVQYGLNEFQVAAQYKMAGYNAEVAGVMAQAQIDAQYGLTAIEIATKYGLSEYQAQLTINMAQAQLAAQYGLTAVQIAAQYDLTTYQAQVSINMAQAQIVSQYEMAGYSAEVAGIMAQAQMAAQYGLAAVEIQAQYDLTAYQAQVAISNAQAQIEAQYGLAGYQAQMQAALAQLQVDSLAMMTQWQAQMDLLKMQINQAYSQDNMNLAAQIAADAAAQQNLWDIQILEMEMDFENQVAASQGFFSFLGTILGWLFKVPTK